MQENRKILIVGAGIMGHGIAQTFAQAGLRVSVVDTTQQALDRGLNLMKSSLQTMDEEGFLKEPRESIVGRVTWTTSLKEEAEDVDMAIEAVFEDVDAKKEIFTQLDTYCPPKALLASNTSFLNIFDFVETTRPDKVLITHWYAPPQLIPLVDVTGGPQTAKESLDAVVQILREIGKRPVVMNKFIPGYAVNRIQLALQREVHFLLDNDYVTPEQLDEAARFGLAFRMMVVGIVQRFDFGGLDLSVKNLQKHNAELTPLDYKPRKLLELVEKGHVGVKSGRGFYNYQGKSEAEVYAERDRRLIRMLKSLQEMER
jgi:3-hydroxybutyryl-CoA dehydrogenase